MKPHLFVLAALLISAQLCALDVSPRIIDGTRVSESQFPTVGKVGDISCLCCTGTLIAPRYVLTAAHCVTFDSGEQEIADSSGLFRLGGVTYQTERIFVHGTYRGGEPEEGMIDLAILRLTAPINGVTPTPLYRKVPALDTPLTIAGYGFEGTGAGGSNFNTPPEGMINFGMTSVEDKSDTFIAWEFDPGESNTAPGDSGGPAFVTEENVRYLAGVTAFGFKEDSSFGDHSFETRIDTNLAWIDHVINEQNTAPAIASSLSATPAVAEILVPVSFAVSATDLDQDRVVFSWNFGDGATAESAVGFASHAYNAVGAYTTTVVISDKMGGTITSTVDVTVDAGGFKGHNAGEEVPVFALKRKFAINFRFFNANYDVTFSGAVLTFASSTEMSAALTGKSAYIVVNNELVDALQLFGTGKGIGNGALKWNYKKGEVKYSLKKGPAGALVRSGAANATTTRNITVPIFLNIEGVRFGGIYDFLYKAKIGRTGAGK